MKREYIEFNEATNAIDYLSKVPFFLKESKEKRTEWKWVVIALHGALYGLAICCVRGTNPEPLRKGNWLKPLGNILKMCQNPEIMKSEHNRTPLEMTEQEAKSIDRLKKEIRNNFEHYSPHTWYLSESLLLSITDDTLNVIEKLHPRISQFCFLSQNQHRQIKSAIFQSRKTLKHYPREYKL
ncbi:MAG: hypothetical protein ACON4O_00805 [Lentimonas sp.]